MPTNVVRTRAAESRSRIEPPPVMVSIPDLDPVVPDTATPNTVVAEQTATTSETSRGPMVPGDRPRQSRKQEKHSLGRLTNPFWTHWGTKVGLAVAACLLLAVLYQVLGRGGGNPPPAGEGDLPTESEMAAAVAGANLGGEKKGQKPAAKRPAGAKRPRPPVAGKPRDGLALQPPGTNAGARRKPARHRAGR